MAKRKRHRAVVLVRKADIHRQLSLLGWAAGHHFTRDHSKAVLLVMMLNAWAGRGYSYRLNVVPNPVDNTYEILESHTYKGYTRDTDYFIHIEQTATNFQRLYGEKDEGVRSVLHM